MEHPQIELKNRIIGSMGCILQPELPSCWAEGTSETVPQK